jgi:GNAT superfamily N-acetyltransferase
MPAVMNAPPQDDGDAEPWTAPPSRRRQEAAIVGELPDVPVFRLGRLAVATREQGHGLGGALLIAAGQRALAVAEAVGGVALAIDAKDENAARWYERFGAVRLLDHPLALMLPLATVSAALKVADKGPA